MPIGCAPRAWSQWSGARVASASRRSHKVLGRAGDSLRVAENKREEARDQIEAGAPSRLTMPWHRNEPGGSKSVVPLLSLSAMPSHWISEESVTMTSSRQRMLLRPSASVRLHQTYPTNEIEASGPTMIGSDALD